MSMESEKGRFFEGRKGGQGGLDLGASDVVSFGLSPRSANPQASFANIFKDNLSMKDGRRSGLDPLDQALAEAEKLASEKARLSLKVSEQSAELQRLSSENALLKEAQKEILADLSQLQKKSKRAPTEPSKPKEDSQKLELENRELIEITSRLERLCAEKDERLRKLEATAYESQIQLQRLATSLEEICPELKESMGVSLEDSLGKIKRGCNALMESLKSAKRRGKALEEELLGQPNVRREEAARFFYLTKFVDRLVSTLCTDPSSQDREVLLCFARQLGSLQTPTLASEQPTFGLRSTIGLDTIELRSADFGGLTTDLGRTRTLLRENEQNPAAFTRQLEEGLRVLESAVMKALSVAKDRGLELEFLRKELAMKDSLMGQFTAELAAHSGRNLALSEQPETAEESIEAVELRLVNSLLSEVLQVVSSPSEISDLKALRKSIIDAHKDSLVASRELRELEFKLRQVGPSQGIDLLIQRKAFVEKKFRELRLEQLRLTHNHDAAVRELKFAIKDRRESSRPAKDLVPEAKPRDLPSKPRDLKSKNSFYQHTPDEQVDF